MVHPGVLTKFAVFTCLVLAAAAARSDGETLDSPSERYEWISLDPHVHSKEKGADGCPFPASRKDLLDYGLKYGLQLLVDDYWGPHRPTPAELAEFPLSVDGKKTENEKLHGNNHILRLMRDKTTGQPTASNIVEGLEVSWFISDRGSHLGILGAKSLDWFYDKTGPEKLKSPFLILDALQAEAKDYADNRPFVIISHMFKWNPKGYPQVVEKDFGRPFEMPMTVAVDGWNVKGLGTEGAITGSPTAGVMAHSPIDVGLFDALVKLSNSGFKMTLIGESDYSCLAHDEDKGPPGSGFARPDVLRTLVGVERKPDGSITYQDVLNAAREGRTIVVNGGRSSPTLGQFAISFGNRQARIGETLAISKRHHAVTIRVQNLPGDTEVLVNGGTEIRNNRNELIRTLKRGKRYRGNAPIVLSESSWIVAHNDNEITSPIYVEVSGEPIRVDTDDPCYFIRHIERAKLELAKQGKGDLTISDYSEDQKPYLLKKYAQAEQVYITRFNEAKKRHGGSPIGHCLIPAD